MQHTAVTTQCLAIISIINFWRKICEYFPICGGVFTVMSFLPTFFRGLLCCVCVRDFIEVH